ncbi:MAG: hypothetical protein C0501_00295 [Isosphaera sp.]|nr:hypothetical protein [Isosphaera sp.]
MRDAIPLNRIRWRFTPAAPPPDRARARAAAGTDGIRHELVARVRAEIAAGTYDTEERWLAAEDALFRAAGR